MSGANNKYGNGVAAGAGVLLGIYLICPVLFLGPIMLAREHGWISSISERNLSLIFAPIFWAGEASPAYQKLLDAEISLGVRLGWVPNFDA